MNLNTPALDLHRRLAGKLATVAKEPVRTPEALALQYTPGVAEPCRVIAADPEAVYTYTGKGNLVAVVSDGSAVLGLGNIGPLAGLPVMEGKSLLFKEFAGINSVPLVLGTQNSQEIIAVVKALAPSFGGINLEDIASPRCFEIEAALQDLGIPVFHDDQHGTAIVVLAGLMNAARQVGKPLAGLRVVINGAGAAGTAIATMLLQAGLSQVTVCDKVGILHRDDASLNPTMAALARQTNPEGRQGNLLAALAGADVFIGVSAARLLTAAHIAVMASRAIVFALANPEPEILPPQALAAGAAIACSGRSDFPNQVNNVLAFPGIFRGALDVRARSVTPGMKLAAAGAIAALAGTGPEGQQSIIPSPFHPELVYQVALAVAQAAMSDGVAQRPLEASALEDTLRAHLLTKQTEVPC
jgi:malate dehydrogenase (oxaloacetate-decarboxylating)